MSIIDSENDVYLALVKALPLLPIDSDEELDRAIAVINALLDKPRLSTGEQGYLDVLSDLVEKYESSAHPLGPVSDGDMLRHLIEAKGITEADVSPATQIACRTISDILSGKGRLTRAQVAKMASFFRVDPTVFNLELPEDAQAGARTKQT